MAIVISSGFVTPAQPAQAQNARPNVVVIMADDLDTRSLQVMLDRGLMPNLQQHIVAQGSTFRFAYVTNSLCCPSRATFLTGQYAHNTGVRTNHLPNGGVRVFSDTNTLATWLHDAGYRTGYIGKYLNGYGRTDLTGEGTIDIQDATYIPPGWDDWQVLVDPTSIWLYNYILNDNGAIVTYGTSPADYQTDVLANRAAQFIRNSAVSDTQPFFLTVTPSAPHIEVSLNMTATQYADMWRWTIRPAPRHAGTVSAPFAVVPSFNEADLSDKPPWMAQEHAVLTQNDLRALSAKYTARLTSLRAVDDMVGTLVSALQETGQLANTVIIFTSDNGFQLGEHRLGEKMWAYEESIRVPLYVRAPGFTSGQTIYQTVLNNDLAPTIAVFAQVTPSLQVDGRSFLPLLGNPALPWRQRFLIEHWRAGALGENLLEMPDYAAVRTNYTRAVPHQLYVEYDDGLSSIEFYDLQADPYQLNSLHADSSPLRVWQRSIHAQWLDVLKECRNGSCQSAEFAR